MHLAPAALRRERDAVDIVEHDGSPLGSRIGASSIGPQAGRGDLPQLVGWGGRSSSRRVPVFFELGGERASAFAGQRKAQAATGVKDGRAGEAIPFQSWVAARAGRCGELTILDEEQPLDHDGRDFFEPLVGESARHSVVEHGGPFPGSAARREPAPRMVVSHPDGRAREA